MEYMVKKSSQYFDICDNLFFVKKIPVSESSSSGRMVCIEAMELIAAKSITNFKNIIFISTLPVSQEKKITQHIE